MALGHPHPEHGGSMSSNVVYGAGRGLQAAGVAVLRFNYRGVGLSEGSHDGGQGEERDHSAALDHLQERFPGVPLWVGGYSFGARIAASLAVSDPRVRQVLLVALPVTAFPCEAAAEIQIPGLALSGGQDAFGTGADLQQRLPSLLGTVRLEEIQGADHFFKGELPELRARIETWARQALNPEGPAT